MRVSREGEAAGAAFWRFSLALYARPGVADALIALQDRAGRDVNLILFGLWAGAARGRRLAIEELAQAETAVAGLNAVVTRFRRLRRQLKPATDGDVQGLRRRLLGLELAAERRVQYRLASGLLDGPETEDRGRLNAAEANLASYLAEERDSPQAAVLRRAVAALARRS